MNDRRNIPGARVTDSPRAAFAAVPQCFWMRSDLCATSRDAPGGNNWPSSLRTRLCEVGGGMLLRFDVVS